MSLLTLFASEVVFGQEKEEPDFLYEIVREIKHPGYLSFDLVPIQIGYMSDFVNFEAGGGARISNYKNKLSAELNTSFVYANISTNKNQLGYRSIGTENKKYVNLDATFGFTVKQDKNKKDRVVRLKVKGNTETVSNMPCTEITSYIIRGGFMMNSFQQRGEVPSNDPNGPNGNIFFGSGDNYEMFQTVLSANIGFMRKVSVNTFFKTDKYGKINESSDFELYGDILINVGNKFPQFNRLFYEDETYPNEITSESAMSAYDQNFVREQFFKLPAGLRIGARQNDYKKSSFFWRGEIGIYPGTYSNYASSIGLKIGIGYRFQNNF